MDIARDDLQCVYDSIIDGVRTTGQESNESVFRHARRKLRRDHGDRQSAHVVAAQSLLSGDPDAVIDLLDQGLVEHGGGEACEDATANRLAGYAWLMKDDPVRAKCFFNDAVRSDPHLPDCWHLLGKIAEADREDEQAADFFKRGALFDDAKHRSAIALSRLHVRNRRFKDAIHTLRVSLLRDQRSPTLNIALGRLLDRRATALAKRQNYTTRKRILWEALQCYRVANASRPTSQSLVMQGHLEQQLFEFSEAIATFQVAVQMDPESSSALTSLAGATLEFGDIEKAVSLFEQALELDPDRAETHFRYSRSKKFRDELSTHEYIESLQTQLSQPRKSSTQTISLEFAKAKVHDDLGQHDQAWGHYQRANQMKSERALSRKADEDRDGEGHSTIEELTQRALTFFTPEFFRTHGGFGHSSKAPVFIVGMPRSGTTLTEQILSSHPSVAGAGELNQVNLIRQQIARDARYSSNTPALSEQTFPFVLNSMGPLEVRRQAEEYLEELNRFRDEESRVTDKMPTNFMYLGLIALLFPNATVIHCRRHPMDVLVSCYCQNLRFPFCDLDQLRSYHRWYRKLMNHWKAVLPIRIFESDYESLVSDPEENTRALIRHCDLSWDDACLAFNDNDRAVHTPSKWQVRQPMYRSSVQKWRRFESQLAPLAEAIDREMREEHPLESAGVGQVAITR